MVFEITQYDTCSTLYEKVAKTNRDMILRVVPRLAAGESVGLEQPHEDEPVLPRRRPRDGVVDWQQSAQQVYDFVRALTRPYPGAFSTLGGQRYLIWNAALVPAQLSSGMDAGTCVGPIRSPVSEACGWVVACRTGDVLLLELEADDGTVLYGERLAEMSWSAMRWVNE
jgi:methionyl-tRNA formyltransferase